MKTYVLIISEKFPVHCIDAGKPTEFMLKIKHYDKIHTLRGNYPLWEKRIKEVQSGNAILSVRMWTGKPYRSKQAEIWRYDATHGVGVEKLEFSTLGYFVNGKCVAAFPEGTERYDDIKPLVKFEKKLAKNDGLTYDQLNEWFPSKALWAACATEPVAIIHFTKFRYEPERN